MDPAAAATAAPAPPAAASAIASTEATTATASSSSHRPSGRASAVTAVRALPPFQPDLFQRGWASVPHPTLPLLATAHNKSVTIFSLTTLSAHSALTGGHSRSVRSVAWKPGLPPHQLCLVTGSFDSTAGLWRYEQDGDGDGNDAATATEFEVTARGRRRHGGAGDDDDDKNENDNDDDDAWEFTLVLEGQEHEIKGVSFSPSGQFLATCSRDKSVWIWEDVGVGADGADDDEWETVAVLGEHDGDVKCVAWCPDVPGRRRGSGRRYGLDALASASYDNTVRVWREDPDGEWTCVAVLTGHTGTVWGVQWEPDPARRRYPRLLTWSADQTVRVWTLDDDEDDDDGNGDDADGAAAVPSRLGGVPNTMRRALHETWTCTAVLPHAHTRDVYSAAWSAASGLVASTGSDGTLVVYAEVDGPAVDEDDKGDKGEKQENGDGAAPSTRSASATHWDVVATFANAHGPYEVNNVTWCRRFDAGAAQRGVDEMLVTTGDDGVVRPWQVV